MQNPLPNRKKHSKISGMEQNDLLKRINDLASRCARQNCITATAFLTPAECYALSTYRCPEDVHLFLSGGIPGCERQMAFFLPWYEEDAAFAAEQLGSYIKAVRIRCPFGTPGHRDYLGAVLGLGLERDRIGDILLTGDTAYLFCTASVLGALTAELDKVGRSGVKTEEVPLSEVTAPERKVKKMNFTVKSLRLDAVTGDMFGLSRTAAQEAIRLGLVSLNYAVCEKSDAPVKEGDVISVRGKGKGQVSAIGGKSKKDRLFIEAEVFC